MREWHGSSARSVPLSNESVSERPKQNHTDPMDPDPQHCVQYNVISIIFYVAKYKPQVQKQYQYLAGTVYLPGRRYCSCLHPHTPPPLHPPPPLPVNRQQKLRKSAVNFIGNRVPRSKSTRENGPNEKFSATQRELPFLPRRDREQDESSSCVWVCVCQLMETGWCGRMSGGSVGVL